MQLQSTVGAPSASQNPGQTPNLRAGALSDLIVSEFMGRYGEASYRKQNFAAANQAAAATTAALATTYTGMGVYNPLGSGVNLHLNKVGFASIVAQTTAMAVGIMAGINPAANPTSVTALVSKNALIGGAAGLGVPFSAATLGVAPTIQTILGTIDTGAVTVSTVNGTGLIDLESSIILPPGAYAMLYTSAASAASSILASMGWMELPV